MRDCLFKQIQIVLHRCDFDLGWCSLILNPLYGGINFSEVYSVVLIVKTKHVINVIIYKVVRQFPLQCHYKITNNYKTSNIEYLTIV